MPNSGTAYDGLIITKISGPEALTGGNFGIEASYVAILLCLIVGVWLMAISHKAGPVYRSALEEKSCIDNWALHTVSLSILR